MHIRAPIMAGFRRTLTVLPVVAVLAGTAGVALAGALVYLLVLGKVDPARWNYQASS